jgi:RimJ/RimL family protein N-acetyltransferase
MIYRWANVSDIMPWLHLDGEPPESFEVWMASEDHCGKGFGPDAIEALCGYLTETCGVRVFMMQPSARNPRAMRAYEKAGFVRTGATAEQIREAWGGVDGADAVMMIRCANPAEGNA